MKKILIIFTVLFLIACQSTDQKILEKAWSQLEASEKSEMQNDWKKGTVQKITLTNEMQTTFSFPENLVNHEVYLVTFPSTNREVVGDVEKLLELDTLAIIGYNYRD